MVPISIILLQLIIYRMTFAVSWTFKVGSDSEAVDTESSKAPCLTYRFQEFIHVHRGSCVSAAVTVHRFVFSIR